MQNIEEIYKEYFETVNKYLFCLTRNNDISEELTQETFYKAVKKVNTYKGDCKIVQDLLPNYIERLTNDVTNQYIEEHISTCAECKEVFDNMQKEFRLNDSKRDNREVKYIKKFNKKLKLLRNILLIIVLLFVIIIGRKTLILVSLSHKVTNTINESNTYTKINQYSEGQMVIFESYNKDGIILGTKINIYADGRPSQKTILYKSKTELLTLIDDGTTKSLKNIGDITINPIFFSGETLFENLWIAITTNIDKVELNGKKCYLIRDGNTEKFIDINTGFAIKMIDNENNTTTDYRYEFGTVKDINVVRPDTTGYSK